MTPAQFHYALKFKAEIELETIKSRMEAARLIAVHVWNSAGRSMKKTEFNPNKLIPFSWDPKPKRIIKKQSPAEIKALLMGQIEKQNKPKQ